MGRIGVSDFEMRHTVESAQPLTFFGNISGDGRHVKYVSGDSLIEVMQQNGSLRYNSLPKIKDAKLKKEIVTRFGLEDDIKSMYATIATDGFITEAIAEYPGSRRRRSMRR